MDRNQDRFFLDPKPLTISRMFCNIILQKEFKFSKIQGCRSKSDPTMSISILKINCKLIFQFVGRAMSFQIHSLIRVKYVVFTSELQFLHLFRILRKTDFYFLKVLPPPVHFKPFWRRGSEVRI